MDLTKGSIGPRAPLPLGTCPGRECMTGVGYAAGVGVIFSARWRPPARHRPDRSSVFTRTSRASAPRGRRRRLRPRSARACSQEIPSAASAAAPSRESNLCGAESRPGARIWRAAAARDDLCFWMSSRGNGCVEIRQTVTFRGRSDARAGNLRRGDANRRRD